MPDRRSACATTLIPRTVTTPKDATRSERQGRMGTTKREGMIVHSPYPSSVDLRRSAGVRPTHSRVERVSVSRELGGVAQRLSARDGCCRLYELHV